MQESSMVRWGSCLLTILFVFANACGQADEQESPPADDDANRVTDADAGDDVAVGTIEVAGSWESDFGAEEIDAEAWGFAELVEFDNDANRAMIRVPDDADYSPGTFSVYVWTEIEDDAFWYCTVEFGLTTLEDARASTAVADATDPGVAGCGDFPWTQLRRAAGG